VWYSSDFLQTPPMPGATIWFPQTVLMLRQNNIRPVVVSRAATPRERSKKIAWFRYHDFCNLTDIRLDEIVFCNEREDKAEIAHKLGAIGVLDNKMASLLPMEGIVQNRLLFCPTEEELTSNLTDIHVVNGWRFVHRKIASLIKS
jgi:hypothetical protein